MRALKKTTNTKNKQINSIRISEKRIFYFLFLQTNRLKYKLNENEIEFIFTEILKI